MNEIINTISNFSFDAFYREATSEAAIVLENLHFLRADWFYAFIPLVLFLVLMRTRSLNNKNWYSVIDPKLLPFVLTGNKQSRRIYPLILTFIAASLCITALAGPVYKKLPQPVYREQSSLVVLLDLSQSMNATDISPSRLYRAKLELLDILKTRKTGQTALVVYAAEAFVVTPLTDDNATIANLVPALTTDMMPAQGSNLSAALAKTVSLFNQAGAVKGDILVITDDINDDDKAAISKVHAQGFRVSVFGIGTSEGGPVPLQNSANGGFLQDSDGAIVIPKMQAGKLQADALLGGGIYTGIRADDSDIKRLNRLFQSSESPRDVKKIDNNADVWQEEGYWLLLPLLLLSALWARKGWIAAVLPFVISFIITVPQPAYADTESTITDKAEADRIDLDHLWFSPDQKAMKAFNAGDTKTAATEFTRPDWKASAYYKSGDYKSAASTLSNPVNSNDYYNKANALAQMGQYKEAITAYDHAIELDGNNDDAKYNREQVKKALEKQQQNQQQGQQDNKDQENKQDKNQQQQGEQNSQDQSQQNQQQDQQAGQQEQQNQDQNQGQQQQENQSAEQSSENEDKDTEQKSSNSLSEEQKQQQEEKELRNRNAEAEAENEQQEKQQYEKQQQEQQADNQANDNEIENRDSDEKPAEVEVNPIEASITEQEKATEQWLKRIPDDPGGLLRRKFLYQYSQMPDQHDDRKPW